MNYSEISKKIIESDEIIINIDEDLNIASFIDHTNLRQDATQSDIKKLCDEYKEYSFASICINPFYVEFARDYLGNKGVITTVIGFPLGQNTTYIKLKETEELLKKGANEFDMVINIGRLKDKDYNYVRNEIKELKSILKDNILKVIIETCLLTDEEKVIATLLSEEGGADFVKTSTGFSSGGATLYDVNLLYRTTEGRLPVKAAGGIRDYKTAVEMIRRGASRIGASRSVDIIKGV